MKLTATIRKDVNRVGINTGKRHIIDVFKIYINLEYKDVSNLKCINKKEIAYEDGYYVIKTYENGLMSYGYMANDPKDRPGHGGCWSSSCGKIYETTGLELIDVIAGGCCYALPIEEAKKILPEGYFITRLGDRHQSACCENEPYVLNVNNGYILD